MKQNISVDASLRYIVGPSAVAGVVFVVFFFLLTRISSLLSNLAFVLLSIAVLAGLCAEIALWQKRGTRRIELNGKTLTLYRESIWCRCGSIAATLREGGPAQSSGSGP